MRYLYTYNENDTILGKYDNDADTILSWAKDERAFYEWNAGNLGDYPISKEEFSVVNDNIAFTAIYDEKIVGFLIIASSSFVGTK